MAMLGSKNIGVASATIHHRLMPNAAAGSAQSWEQDESFGDSVGRMRGRAKDCDSASCRTSPSSTVTSELSVSAGRESKIAALSAKDEESLDTIWTDDRHSSYLSSMEEMFVRNMYDREYCALDICGELASSCEQDCVESRPASNFFKVMQGGGWQPLPCRRLHSWELPSPTIFSSPWVRHFTSSKPSAQEEHHRNGVTTTAAAAPKAQERIICRTSTEAYEMEDDAPEVPDVENRSSAWLERIHSRSTASSSATSAVATADTGKRPDRGEKSSFLLATASRQHSAVSSVDQVVPFGDAELEPMRKRRKQETMVSVSIGENRGIYSRRVPEGSSQAKN